MSFGSRPDPDALALARELYSKTNALVGVDTRGSIEGFRGEEVELRPALPLGEHRHHLEWLHASLEVVDTFIASITSRAPRPVVFDPHPRGFAFFQTAVSTYPSAYSSEGVIGYNLRGPLHADPGDVQQTLFHELFHLNDARQHTWSVTALRELFDSILDRCGDDHECFRAFAPYETVVPNGTYYAFDKRTRDVREYAAELALRYFVEHQAFLASEPPKLPPFKCLTPENRVAWDRMVDAFFGGVDLSPDCDEPLQT